MPNSVIASSSGFVDYEGFNVNVTSRVIDLAPSDKLTEITALTIKVWAYAAKHIQKGLRTCEKSESAEMLAESTFAYDEPPCTVWGDALYKHGLTVYSHTNPQDAIATFWQRYDALEQLGIVNGQSQNVTSGNGSNSTTAQLEDGIIIGKMNPSSAKVYYENGQVVALPVKKIVLAYREGWYYEFWTGLGNNQYPGVKVFKTKKNSDENSDAYKAMKDVIEGLQLDPDKRKSVEGDWWIIGNINHVEKDGTTKEFFNPIELRMK